MLERLACVAKVFFKRHPFVTNCTIYGALYMNAELMQQHFSNRFIYVSRQSAEEFIYSLSLSVSLFICSKTRIKKSIIRSWDGSLSWEPSSMALRSMLGLSHKYIDIASCIDNDITNTFIDAQQLNWCTHTITIAPVLTQTHSHSYSYSYSYSDSIVNVACFCFRLFSVFFLSSFLFFINLFTICKSCRARVAKLALTHAPHTLSFSLSLSLSLFVSPSL